ncbi:MAG: hypothetical protein AB7I25_00340 [Vicinamibacterales bacterium]
MRRACTIGFVILATGLPHAQRGPAPAASGLDPDQIALLCAPAPADLPDRAPLPQAIQVTGGQAPVVRQAYAPGDLVTISAGERQGITVGQEFITRLPVPAPTKKRPASRHIVQNTGWLRVYAVDDDLSLATITHACSTVNPGDELAPFTVAAVPEQDTRDLEPKRNDYARIVAGAGRRTTFATGDLFLIDRGSSKGVHPGARFVLYHDRGVAKNFLYEAGEAVAVAVGADASTLRVIASSTAVVTGDYVGQRTEQPRHRAPATN